MTVISTATKRSVGTISSGPGPVALAVSPDSSRLYVVNNGAGGVSQIGHSTNGRYNIPLRFVASAPPYPVGKRLLWPRGLNSAKVIDTTNTSSQ